MNKFLILGLSVFLLLGVASAIYIVNSFSIQVDVIEPFEVSYAIVGDADNWDGVSCLDYTGVYSPIINNEIPIDKVGLYAGEGRAFCFKINNFGQADIPFTISNKITNTNATINAKCVNAFGLHILDDTAVALTETTVGVGVVVDAGTEPVNDCIVKIEVAR